MRYYYSNKCSIVIRIRCCDGGLCCPDYVETGVVLGWRVTKSLVKLCAQQEIIIFKNAYQN